MKCAVAESRACATSHHHAISYTLRQVGLDYSVRNI